MITLHLVDNMVDWIDVRLDDERIGQITPSADGWAVYCATNWSVRERRMTTTKNLNAAVYALKAAQKVA